MSTLTVVQTTVSKSQAREVTERIKENAQSLAVDLLYMYSNQGYIALGYVSWHEYLVNEFRDLSHTYLRRITHAALLEEKIGLAPGSVPESHLRPLNEILDTDEEKSEVYHKVMSEVDNPIALDFRRYATAHFLAKSNPFLFKRVHAGEITAKTAYELHAIALRYADDPELSTVILSCGDAKLAEGLVKLKSSSIPLWQEVLYTGTIPSFPDPIPIEVATFSSLASWISLDSAESRARHVEFNREHYNNLRDAYADLEYSARKIKETGPVESALSRLFSSLDTIDQINGRNIEPDKHVRSTEEHKT